MASFRVRVPVQGKAGNRAEPSQSLNPVAQRQTSNSAWELLSRCQGVKPLFIGFIYLPFWDFKAVKAFLSIICHPGCYSHRTDHMLGLGGVLLCVGVSSSQGSWASGKGFTQDKLITQGHLLTVSLISVGSWIILLYRGDVSSIVASTTLIPIVMAKPTHSWGYPFSEPKDTGRTQIPTYC